MALTSCQNGCDVAVIADACASTRAKLHNAAIDDILRSSISKASSTQKDPAAAIVSVSSIVPRGLRVPLPYLGPGDSCCYYNCIENLTESALAVLKETYWGSRCRAVRCRGASRPTARSSRCSGHHQELPRRQAKKETPRTRRRAQPGQGPGHAGSLPAAAATR